MLEGLDKVCKRLATGFLFFIWLLVNVNFKGTNLPQFITSLLVSVVMATVLSIMRI